MLLPPAPSAADDLAGPAIIFCGDCAEELAPWAVHLLKRPHCPACDGELELAGARTRRDARLTASSRACASR